MEDLYDSCSEVSDGSEASTFGDEQFLEHSAGDARTSTAGSHGYAVLTPDVLHSFQDKALADVANVLACSASVARTLLIHFRWSVESLFGANAVSDRPLTLSAAQTLNIPCKYSFSCGPRSGQALQSSRGHCCTCCFSSRYGGS